MATSNPAAAFVFRPLLDELTVAVNFHSLDPYQAYAWLYQRQREMDLKPEVYCSSSITSGGHARVPQAGDDSLEAITLTEVIRRNTRSGKLLAEQLARDNQLDPAKTIEPVFVGNTGWNQAEFIQFWMLVIGGFELEQSYGSFRIDNLRAAAQEACVGQGVNIDYMISHALPAERAPEYFKMAQAFGHLIASGVPAQPIEIIIRMVDTEMSLGCQTERAFGRQIGCKVMNITPVKPANLTDLNIVNHQLAEDTARLIQYGATVFDTDNNNVQLVLTADTAA